MTEAYTIALGESSFPALRENARNYFVDKSHFITRVLTDASVVQLFPRPRRFGKTLNLTMIWCGSWSWPAPTVATPCCNRS